jgi:hypothetical protein
MTIKELTFMNVAEDSSVSIEGRTQKELDAEIILVLEEQSIEISNLYSENLKLKRKIRKLEKLLG